MQQQEVIKQTHEMKSVEQTTGLSDRFSFLWLALAFGLSLFTSIRWSIPLAAWLAPVFMLRFTRTQPALHGLLLVWLATFATIALTSQGTLPPGLFYFLFAAGTALAATLPYLADRLIVTRLGGFLATLVFPVAWTSYEYLSAQIGPNGTIGSLAYTQYGNLPLMQLVAVTGIWGITFLVTWFAPVGNWAWESGFVWPQVRWGTLLYSGILAVVLLSGGARLAFFQPEAMTVRIAGISPSRAVEAVYDQQRRNGTFDALFTGKATNAQRETARVAYAHLTDDLLMRTEQEAKAGAKIVLWPEAGTSVLQEDEAALLARASTLTAKDGIYLEMGLIIVTDQSPFAQNKAILLDPTGKVVWSYDKAHPVPGEPWLPGDGKVPTSVTPYGRLATVICFDADFYFTSDAQVMVAYVPTNGVRTIYAAIGDLFAWLCIAGLVIFIGMAVVQRRAKAVDERQALPRPERVLEEKVP